MTAVVVHGGRRRARHESHHRWRRQALGRSERASDLTATREKSPWKRATPSTHPHATVAQRNLGVSYFVCMKPMKLIREMSSTRPARPI